MQTLRQATRWQKTIMVTGVRVRSQAHHSQLPILPAKSGRMLKPLALAHLPIFKEANEVVDEVAVIRGVEEVAENGVGAGDVATNAMDVIRMNWAALSGGILPVCL